jgi:geranylgeranyl diphosphate synthase, type II
VKSATIIYILLIFKRKALINNSMLANTEEITSILENALSDINLPDSPESLYGPLRYALGHGGKRIRPRLALLACGMCGGNIHDAVPAAMSVELLHNFTLIHDDIMDKADSRRGRPTIHSHWNLSTAILSGDVLFAIAWNQLNVYGSDQRFSKADYHTLHELFYNAIRYVCEGQALDLEFERMQSVTIEEYLDMISGKTASLLSCSLRMGVVVAGGDEESINLAGVAGMEAGLAFQIQDDLLDATGDPVKFGKKVGGDIKEGKKTWLSILAIQKAGDTDKKFIMDILQKKENSEDEIRNVIELYYHLGVIEETQTAVESHYRNAISHLDKFADSFYKNEIKALFSQLMNRDT